MKVLALDPGYDRCGVAVLERTEKGIDTIIDSLCITTNPKDSFDVRMFNVASTVKEWVVRHNPDYCVLENLFFASNQKTAMHVAEVRGALLYIIKEQSIPIEEFTPKQVKIAVTGDGNATKKQVILMLEKLVRITKPIRYDDEYDAIAVGVTALASIVLRSTYK